MRFTKSRREGRRRMRRAANAALLIAATALSAAGAGCGTTASGPPPAADLAGGPAGGPAAAAHPPAPPEPDVSEEPLPANEREAMLRRLASTLDRPGESRSRHAAALQALERYVAQRPREREDAALALLGRLLSECVRLGGSLAEALERADALSRASAGLSADLGKVSRERDELKAVVQRLKDLEMSMEEKRKRMR